MAKASPPIQETVSKFCTETGKPQKEVLDSIGAYAESLQTKNLDFAAWLWVQEQGADPPALKAEMSFSKIDKPWIPLAEAASGTIPKNTSFNVRGWVFGYREGRTKKDKPMNVITLVDESCAKDVLVFGEQCDKVSKRKLTIGDTPIIRGAQTMTGDRGTAVTMSGDYTALEMSNPTELQLPPIRELKSTNMSELKNLNTYVIRGLVGKTEQNVYNGCPNCRSKYAEKIPAGAKADCPRSKEKGGSCGMITVTEMAWTSIHVFDDTGEAKLRFGPDTQFSKEQLSSLKKRRVMAVGTLGDREEFNATFMCPEDELPQTPTTTSVPAPQPQTPAPTVTVPTNAPAQAVPLTGTLTVTIPTQPTVVTKPATPSGLSPKDLMVEYIAIYRQNTMEKTLDYGKRKSGASDEEVEDALMDAIADGKIVREEKDGKVVLRKP